MDNKTLLRVVRAYKTEQNKIARAEETRKLLAEQLREEIRERGVDTVRVGHHCVSLRDVTTQTVDIAALREAAPAIAELYQVTRTTARLTVS